MLCSNYFFCQSATEIRLIKSANKANEPTAEASMRKRNEYVPFAYRRLRRQMRNGSLTVRFDHATHTSTEREAICQPSAGADFTYQEYTKEPELWKRGFVLGISRYMSAVAQPDEEAPYPVRTAFQRCLASSTDTTLVRQVDTYVAANPAGSKGPMVAVIMRALFDLCRS